MRRARRVLRRSSRSRFRRPRCAIHEYHPEDEFELKSWLPIHLGPLDLSINKAVAYLWLGALLTMLLGIVPDAASGSGHDPDRRQTVGETIYDLVETQIAEQGLPAKAIGVWFPYVASLFLYIWILNLVGFVPLPLTEREVPHRRRRAPDLGDLRRDRAALGDADARDPQRRLHARRGLPLQRPGLLRRASCRRASRGR